MQNDGQKQNRRRLYGTLVILALIGLGLLAYWGRRHFYAKDLNDCLRTGDFDRCIAIGRQLHARKNSRPEFDRQIETAILNKAETLPPNQTVPFLKEMQTVFPALTEIRATLPEAEFLRLQQQFQQNPATALKLGDTVLQQYPKHADLWFKIGLMHLKIVPPHLKTASTYFGRAAELEAIYRNNDQIATALKEALANLTPPKVQTSLNLIRNFYLESLLPFLKENLHNQSTAILRNNAFALLNEKTQLTEVEIFHHHWLNLLSGSTLIAAAYRDSVAFFEGRLAASLPPPADFKADFSFFPIIDQVPDFFTQESLKLLMRLYPKATAKALRNFLKDKQHLWRRANSFSTLKSHKQLSAWQQQSYHQANLKLKTYDFFTGWLVESIDYFAGRGSNGKNTLRTFVKRISQLKLRARRRGKADQAAVYKQIEQYTRPKIGRQI